MLLKLVVVAITDQIGLRILTNYRAAYTLH